MGLTPLSWSAVPLTSKMIASILNRYDIRRQRRIRKTQKFLQVLKEYFGLIVITTRWLFIIIDEWISLVVFVTCWLFFTANNLFVWEGGFPISSVFVNFLLIIYLKTLITSMSFLWLSSNFIIITSSRLIFLSASEWCWFLQYTTFN